MCGLRIEIVLRDRRLIEMLLDHIFHDEGSLSFGNFEIRFLAMLQSAVVLLCLTNLLVASELSLADLPSLALDELVDFFGIGENESF